MPRRIQDSYTLRLPDGLRDRIKVAAAQNRRSMNAEILFVLEREYPSQAVTDAAETTAGQQA